MVKWVANEPLKLKAENQEVAKGEEFEMTLSRAEEFEANVKKHYNKENVISRVEESDTKEEAKQKGKGK